MVHQQLLNLNTATKLEMNAPWNYVGLTNFVATIFLASFHCIVEVLKYVLNDSKSEITKLTNNFSINYNLPQIYLNVLWDAESE